MDYETMPSHDNDEPYFFMNDAKFDYGLLARQLQEQKRIGPREYTGANYIIQAQTQSIDKAVASSLFKKVLEDYDWSNVEQEPIVISTEDFKSIALGLNAAIFYGAGGHEHK